MSSEVPIVDESKVTPESPIEPAAPLSLRDSLSHTFDRIDSEAAAAEAAAEGKPVAEETAATPEPGGDEQETAETTNAAPEGWVSPTPEQLAETAFWGSLTEDGWKQMERERPAETKIYKASQAAGTRFVNEARKEAQKILEDARAQVPPAADRSTEATTGPSEEYLRAFEMTQSLDPTEAAEGHRTIARLVMKEERESETKAAQAVENLVKGAFSDAVNARPEIQNLDFKELDAIVESDKILTALVNTGMRENIALAMTSAADTLIGRNKAKTEAADKAKKEAAKKETQKVVKSNERVASAAVVKPTGAAPPVRETLATKLDKIAADRGLTIS